MRRIWVLAFLALSPSCAWGQSSELHAPVRIEAGGKPIESGGVGHAAPFVADFFGDGKPHLLVGQFEGGFLKIYKNEGTRSAPKFAPGITFEAGGKSGTVPTG